MKKILTTAFALGLVSSVANAELIPGAEVTVGAERELEAEVNAIYGEVSMGAVTVGAVMEDTADDSGSFNIQEYTVEVEQPIGPVTLYMENEFDDSFKHAETVVGGKIKF